MEIGFLELNYVIIVGFLFLTVIWLWKINKTRIWLCNRQEPKKNKGKWYALLPVLNEEKRLTKTVNYFLKQFPECEVVLITTAAENKNNSTILLAKKLSKNNRVKHTHHDQGRMNMAAQLNTAMRMLPKGLFGVFNADSRPDPRTMHWVWSAINDGELVCQQYGAYGQNEKNFTGWTRSILLAAAAWQNRWSLGFEIAHARKQFKKNILPTLNYCIGHGLFFVREAYDKVGGFSEDTHNEDAILGLQFSYYGIKIVPLPVFDDADSPDSVKGLFFQKANWFFGPSQILTYMKKIVQQEKARKQKIRYPRLIFLSIKLWLCAVYWIVGPTAFVLASILGFIHYEQLLLVILMSILFHTTINAYAWKVIGKKNLFEMFFLGLIGSPISYCIHGLSAYRALWWMGRSFFGSQINKKRTPMGFDKWQA